MFTGIVTDIAKIESLVKDSNSDLNLRLKLLKNRDFARKFEIGCSISCSGMCLTLIKKEESADHFLFDFQISGESVAKTKSGIWQKGDEINIEFALRMGDELGGHLVSGHVDCVTKLKSIKKIDESHRFEFEKPQDFAKFISPKGSIVLDGISLTINDVTASSFFVNIIDHTFHNTSLRNLKIGGLVNLEIDQIARYLFNLNLQK